MKNDEMGGCQPFTLIAAGRQDTENDPRQELSLHFIPFRRTHNEMGRCQPFTLIAARRQDTENDPRQEVSLHFIPFLRTHDEMGGCHPFTLIAAWNKDTEKHLFQNLSFPFILATPSDLSEHCDAPPAHGKLAVYRRLPGFQSTA